MKKENMQNISEVSLKSLFKILAKRKKVFLIAFVIVLLAGLTFSFLVSPEYRSTSQITLSDNEIFYNDALYKFFPAEADSLWIIPDLEEEQRIDYIVGKLDPIDMELKSDLILNNALNALQNKISRAQLIRAVNISIDRWVGMVTVDSYARTSELAYNINRAILNSYINQKRMELKNTYNMLLEKLGHEIDLSEKEIAALEADVEKEPLNQSLRIELNAAIGKMDVLNTTWHNMTNNKNIFIDRIKIVQAPELIDVKDTSSYLRNILLSIFASITVGIIAAFIVNYFKNP